MAVRSLGKSRSLRQRGDLSRLVFRAAAQGGERCMHPAHHSVPCTGPWLSTCRVSAGREVMTVG